MIGSIGLRKVGLELMKEERKEKLMQMNCVWRHLSWVELSPLTELSKAELEKTDLIDQAPYGRDSKADLHDWTLECQSSPQLSSLVEF